MAKKSRNNRRKIEVSSPLSHAVHAIRPSIGTRMHDTLAHFITVKNVKEDRVIGVFDYSELCRYLDANSIKLEAVIIEPSSDYQSDVCCANLFY